jgi:hypothetical protein
MTEINWTPPPISGGKGRHRRNNITPIIWDVPPIPGGNGPHRRPKRDNTYIK